MEPFGAWGWTGSAVAASGWARNGKSGRRKDVTNVNRPKWRLIMQLPLICS